MDETTTMNWGGSGFWIFALLILVFGMNGGLGFGGNKSNPASQSDVVYTSAFNQLQQENGEIKAEIQRTAYEAMGTTKDAAYNNLSEIRDLETAVNTGFSNMQTCCCQTQKEILSNRYENALNTASINANITAANQKVLDAIAANKISDLEAKVQALELANATANVVRYPTSMSYTAGTSPFCNGCGCGGTTI